MPKVKMARKSTHIDMTAMCDVAFLLLSFFMLATKFKPDEPVVVSTPSSISQIIMPDTSIMMITIDAKDRVFFTVDRKNVAATGGKDSRMGLINDMDEFKQLGLTDEEKMKFVKGASIGVPLNQLKSFLSQDGPTMKELEKTAAGIPIPLDSVSSTSNELADWITVARNNNPFLRIVIKADGETKFGGYQKVLRTLSDMKLNTFSLITNVQAVPPGTAAYENAMRGDTK
jgi:biopolymer transport protein ExbD